MERRKKHMRAWIARMTEDNIDQSAIEKKYRANKIRDIYIKNANSFAKI